MIEYIWSSHYLSYNLLTVFFNPSDLHKAALDVAKMYK